jgi:CBS domain-containing protein
MSPGQWRTQVPRPEEEQMQARDVMVSPVITVKPSASVRDVAKIFLKHKISAVPVVDDHGKVVGIVSEGDLLHRVENDTEMRHSSWLRLLTQQEVLAVEYAKSHSRKVADVMTKRVISAAPDTSLSDIAMLMERHSIKRVPILNEGRLVGIVSRANLIQAIATARPALEIPLSDQAIRDKLLAHLRAQPWPHTAQLNATVKEGIVDVWGICHSDAEREAVRIAAENIPGVRAVNNNLSMPPIGPFI